MGEVLGYFCGPFAEASEDSFGFTPVFHLIMSQHPTLKSSKSVGAKRNVLKRFERIKQLKAEGRFKEGQLPVNLPKTKPEM